MENEKFVAGVTAGIAEGSRGGINALGLLQELEPGECASACQARSISKTILSDRIARANLNSAHSRDLLFFVSSFARLCRRALGLPRPQNSLALAAHWACANFV